MEYLHLENIKKSYAEKILFENLSLTISKGQKIALIAKNGSGKSTLLKVIASIEKPEGENALLRLNSKITVGYLAQEPEFLHSMTIMEAIYENSSNKIKALREYEQAIEKNDEEAISQSLIIVEALNAWDIDAKIKEILGRFNIYMPDAKVGTLSGGQKKRLALAQLLISNPDFIVLDEPTNHLDIEMIEWLEKMLSQSDITLLMVTHDRYFLDNVCNTIYELESGILHSYSGNYSQYLIAKNTKDTIAATVYEKNRKRLKQELDWVSRMPKARTTKNKARVDQYHSLKETNSNYKVEESFTIDVACPRLGKTIININELNYSFGEKVILRDFSYKFSIGERVGIVGANGSGKSTFVKLITKELEAQSGSVHIGNTVITGHYRQEGMILKEDKMMIELIREVAEYIPLAENNKISAESLLEKFLFPRSQQRVFVSQLSGGERKRLQLIYILLQNPNFLIFDEPTNDLDIKTIEILEEYLGSYPGNLLLISHDRMMIDRICDHIFVLDGLGNVIDYNGAYSEWKNEKYQLLKKSNEKPPIPTKNIEVKTVELPKKKLSYQEQKEMKSIETKIESIENTKKLLEEQVNNPTKEVNANDIYRDLGNLQKELDALEERWLEIVASLEE